MRHHKPYYTLVLIFIVLILTKCVSQDKKDAADFFLKGNQALNHINYTEALRLYDEAIAKNAEFSDAYLNKGITLLKLNRAEEAYEVLTKAVSLDPTLAQANLVRAEAGLSLGKLRDAALDLQKIEKEYKDSSKYYLVKGNVLEARGDQSSAIAEYDHALLLNKNNVEALVNRGAIYYRLHSYAIAKDNFHQAIKLDPSQPQALNNLGLIATKEGDWNTAVAYFDLVLNKKPNEAFSLNNKGYVFLQTGRLEEAKKLIDRSMSIAPKNGYAIRNMGIYYQQIGQTAKAISEYQKAIDIAEPVELLYGLIGQAYIDQGNRPEACKFWKQGMMLKDVLAVEMASKFCN